MVAGGGGAGLVALALIQDVGVPARCVIIGHFGVVRGDQVAGEEARGREPVARGREVHLDQDLGGVLGGWGRQGQGARGGGEAEGDGGGEVHFCCRIGRSTGCLVGGGKRGLGWGS